MRTQLALSHLQIVPGVPSRVEIEVTNTSEVIDGVTVIVDGVDPDWLRFDVPVVSLFPGSTSTIGFTVDVPADCPAGDYLVVARVVSTIDADRQTVHDFWISVDPVVALGLRLRPSVVTGGATATLEATVSSIGNTAATVVVTALDPSRQVDCQVVPPDVVVPRGGEAATTVRLRGPRPWFGQTLTRSVVVTAQCDDVVVEEIATFNQKPRIPRGVFTFAVLAGIVALWAAIFLLVADAIGEDTASAKATATDFDEGGAANVPLAAIAGTATGTVRASTTGEGVPRITVEAFRVRSSGELEPSGAAATDDAGVYELPSLLPGSYLLSFTADGFDPLWYPSAADQSGAAPVTVEPTQAVEDLDVVLTGQPGSFLGTIEVPESAGGPPQFTVTATQVLGEDAEGEPFELAQPTAGEIRLEGLPAPAAYRIRVEGSDFEPQEFTEELGAGEVKVLNTVRLGAAAGSVAGVVVDAAGQPLGGVAVTVASGDTVFEATTPTSGNVGQFLVVGLETPLTWVLTFELEGYTGQTVALDLLAGENRSGITATLVGGSGTVSGTARDPAGNPVGGATVTVRGNDFQAVTSTLTTAGDGGIGSYRVTDIPVPGNYTVTFEAAGYVSETISVGFIAAGERPLSDVVLRPEPATIGGTVRVGGVPTGGVTVELSDGLAVRTTATATDPAGAFTFADVPAGSYTLRFSSTAARPRIVLVRVAAGDALDASVDLAPVGG